MNLLVIQVAVLLSLSTYIQGNCMHNGITYEDGVSFKIECNNCFCSGGSAACTKKFCFPSIQDCEVNGKWYYNGEKYKDDCNTCTCIEGVPSCTEMECPSYELCEDGEMFKIDCNTCTCTFGIPFCTLMACPIQGTCLQGSDCDEVDGSVMLDGISVCCQDSDEQLELNRVFNRYSCACNIRMD